MVAAFFAQFPCGRVGGFVSVHLFVFKVVPIDQLHSVRFLDVVRYRSRGTRDEANHGVEEVSVGHRFSFRRVCVGRRTCETLTGIIFGFIPLAYLIGHGFKFS